MISLYNKSSNSKKIFFFQKIACQFSIASMFAAPEHRSFLKLNNLLNISNIPRSLMYLERSKDLKKFIPIPIKSLDFSDKKEIFVIMSDDDVSLLEQKIEEKEFLLIRRNQSYTNYLKNAKEHYEYIQKFPNLSFEPNGDEIIIKDQKNIFSQKISKKFFSDVGLPERLTNNINEEMVSHPLFLFPNRISIIKEIISKAKITEVLCIEGISCIGKSHVAMMIYLYYQYFKELRVIYVPAFNKNNYLDNLFSRIFITFYEDIKHNNELKIILNLFCYISPNFNDIVSLYKLFVKNAQKNGKKVISIHDQINSNELNSNLSFQIIDSIGLNTSILFTSSTEKNISQLTRKDNNFLSRALLKFTEEEQNLKENQILELIKLYFSFNNSDENKILILRDKTNGSFEILSEFKKFLQQNELSSLNDRDFIIKLEYFLKRYKDKINIDHFKWKNEHKNLNEAKISETIINLLNNSQHYFEPCDIDMKFIYQTKEGDNFFINPIVQEYFLDRYVDADLIEKFVNTKYSYISNSTFGRLFKLYFRRKLSKKNFVFNLDNDFRLIIEDFFHNALFYKKNDSLEFISKYYDLKQNTSYLLTTSQQNFPLYEMIYKDINHNVYCLSIKCYRVNKNEESFSSQPPVFDLNKIKKLLSHYNEYKNNLNAKKLTYIIITYSNIQKELFKKLMTQQILNNYIKTDNIDFSFSFCPKDLNKIDILFFSLEEIKKINKEEFRMEIHKDLSLY